MSAAFWDRVAERYAARPVGDEAAYEAALARVRHWLGPEMRVLELGCGTGMTAEKLAGSVLSLEGTDFSPEMIRIAEARRTAGNLRFSCAPAETALAGGPYDAVLAFNLLHLLDDLPGCLSRVHGALADGGLLISKTPCLGAKWYLWPVIRLLQGLGKLPRFRFLRPGALEAAILASGFEIVETGDYPRKLPGRLIVARKTR
ncbi:class I SAM-dependent methyltransferase [Salipiger abyssi]|uniref:class I SAM-dependent methyltransferase n=1 Tax=Salipiger abyssi TaxID=1250539 RepID=UPI0040595199